MAKTTSMLNANNLKAVDKITIIFDGEIKDVYLCECDSHDMISSAGMHLHTCMEALIANADDILIPSEIVNGEVVNYAKVMTGDIIFAASNKFMKDFWLKFDKKKQAMMIHIIIARTAALMSGVTCMTDLYDKVMIYMNTITADNKSYSRSKVIAALKKINSYEENFCKKYLKELSKANIGVTSSNMDEEFFGDYNDTDDDDFDDCDCECCCG